MIRIHIQGDSFAGDIEGQIIGIACGSAGTPLKDNERRGRTQQQQNSERVHRWLPIEFINEI